MVTTPLKDKKTQGKWPISFTSGLFINTTTLVYITIYIFNYILSLQFLYLLVTTYTGAYNVIFSFIDFWDHGGDSLTATDRLTGRRTAVPCCSSIAE